MLHQSVIGQSTIRSQRDHILLEGVRCLILTPALLML